MLVLKFYIGGASLVLLAGLALHVAYLYALDSLINLRQTFLNYMGR